MTRNHSVNKNNFWSMNDSKNYIMRRVENIPMVIYMHIWALIFRKDWLIIEGLLHLMKIIACSWFVLIMTLLFPGWWYFLLHWCHSMNSSSYVMLVVLNHIILIDGVNFWFLESTNMHLYHSLVSPLFCYLPLKLIITVLPESLFHHQFLVLR